MSLPLHRQRLRKAKRKAELELFFKQKRRDMMDCLDSQAQVEQDQLLMLNLYSQAEDGKLSPELIINHYPLISKYLSPSQLISCNLQKLAFHLYVYLTIDSHCLLILFTVNPHQQIQFLIQMLHHFDWCDYALQRMAIIMGYLTDQHSSNTLNSIKSIDQIQILALFYEQSLYEMLVDIELSAKEEDCPLIEFMHIYIKNSPSVTLRAMVLEGYFSVCLEQCGELALQISERCLHLTKQQPSLGQLALFCAEQVEGAEPPPYEPDEL